MPPSVRIRDEQRGLAATRVVTELYCLGAAKWAKAVMNRDLLGCNVGFVCMFT